MGVHWTSLHTDATSSEVQIVPMPLNIHTVLGHCRLQELSPLIWSLTFMPVTWILGFRESFREADKGHRGP